MCNYSRSVSMYCPICGNDQFSCVDEEIEDLSNSPDDTRIQCADCKTIFTKAELIEANQDNISANVEEIEQEIMSDLEKKFGRLFG